LVWNKNDYLAAGLIITIIVVAVLIGLNIAGVFNPNINTAFPFG